MAHPSPSILRAIIADLQARLDALPSIDGSDYRGTADQHYKRREAAKVLAEYLRTKYGARITGLSYETRIRMHGIVSSCTAGQAGCFRNWIRAAERRIAAFEESQP
ncbi:hypothetical protein SAMN04244548_02989 [Paracoccus pantotrophus]|nr:hypothetical protein SAMN04244548_02989 [Paracoccus pantotrophus]